MYCRSLIIAFFGQFAMRIERTVIGGLSGYKIIFYVKLYASKLSEKYLNTNILF